MFDLEVLKGIISKSSKNDISKEKIAMLLKTTPEALESFEKAYHTQVIQKMPDTRNLFDMDAKSVKEAVKKKEGRRVTELSQNVDELVNRIVKELLAQAIIYSYDGSVAQFEESLYETVRNPVDNSDLCQLPISIRPQFTGYLSQIDVSDHTYADLLQQYYTYKTAEDPVKRKNAYHMFRQGLDILDLDPVTYAILGMNPNAMGYWFPALVDAINAGNMFKLPKTKILKVPLTMLQLTRLDYGALNPTTLRIVDEFCYKAFDLKEDNEYFVKTGTYSFKFNFRNAHVAGAKEVRELGEYLLFIQNQACMAAGPLSQPCIYGMSTTNEWVVREYIKDKENNPCIYKGMPLHTEYRVFVDLDTDEILGMTPYWRSDVMKQRLGNEKDADSPHNIHDYAIFLTHEDTLIARYEENKEKVMSEMRKLIPHINLPGQWSIDIMQNGTEFYIIDMALAQESALSDCVPKGKIKHIEVNWIPKLEDI